MKNIAHVLKKTAPVLRKNCHVLQKTVLSLMVMVMVPKMVTVLA